LIMGCPVFLWVLLLLCNGALTKGKICKLLFLRYLSCKDAFWRLKINSERKKLIQEHLSVLKSEFSVKRNLLEKAFAYTRGSVSFEHKIG
jgi:hypothetical protein